jgi:hypothetical protein
MPYTINKFNNEPLIVLEDGTIDTSTSLGLVGRNYVGYGETQNENFVWLLENFANNYPPARPLRGQTWFDTLHNTLHVYDGSQWNKVGSAVLSEIPPEAPTVGSFWLKDPVNTLYCWTGSEWHFIGPETAEGFNTTRARSTTLPDSDNVSRPVIELVVNDGVIAIISASAFTINPTPGILGFSEIVAGINLNTSTVVKGDVVGNAATATKLDTARRINNVPFDGTADITITSATTSTLTRGSYLTGSNFNGVSPTTWAVDANSANIPGKVVVRNSSGGFSAGVVSADLYGNVTAVSGISSFDIVQANEFVGATLSGNAGTATKLKTARKINGVNFDGTADITVTANAQTLTGNGLANGVEYSSLRTVGTLNSLNVAATGISIGPSNELRIYTDPNVGIRSKETLSINIFDNDAPGGFADLRFITAASSLSLGGDNLATLAPNVTQSLNLGHLNRKFSTMYADTFNGTATLAAVATKANNIAGGTTGSIPYQTNANTTAMLPIGSPGAILRAAADNQLVWGGLTLERLTAGDYITYGGPTYFDAGLPVTIAVDASSSNSANKVVARDGSGNFSAGTITASLNGNASTVTNGVYTNGSYSNPSWITSLAGSKVTGIPNSSLNNSSITINGSSVALGGSITVNGFGAGGQTWQNVTGSRGFGVNYTNDTGKTIWVNTRVYTPDNDSDDPYQWTIAFVDGNEVDYAQWNNNYRSTPVYMVLGFFVPPGSTYKVNIYTTDEPVNALSYGQSIVRWSEFR